MAKIKLRQKGGGGVGVVKESLLAKHKVGPKTRSGDAKPLAKYWIKYKQEVTSKTEDAADKAGDLKTKREMSRRWKGKLGTLLE
jgi:hypothetical protein